MDTHNCRVSHLPTANDPIPGNKFPIEEPPNYSITRNVPRKQFSTLQLAFHKLLGWVKRFPGESPRVTESEFSTHTYESDEIFRVLSRWCKGLAHSFARWRNSLYLRILSSIHLSSAPSAELQRRSLLLLYVVVVGVVTEACRV